MAIGRLIQNKFNAGVWSPLLEGRIDLEKYPSALYRLENFILWPHGPAQFRPGFRFIHPTKDNGLARLIPFEFSVTQAYQIEFGDQYLRFFRNQAIITETAQAVTAITKANPGVVTYSGADNYANGDRLIAADIGGMVELNNREVTVANVNVGANTFELSGIDTTNYTTYTSGGTVAEIYEIASPYLEADLNELKFCQSADVLYIWHPDYAPRKLTRTGHTSWTLTEINWSPGPTFEEGLDPDATLTLGAVTGTGITFTAGSSKFLQGDVGRIITSGAGKASIVGYTSGTIVTCDIIDDFAAVGPIASGSWTIEGSPNGTISPSIKEPTGAICTITSADESETYTDLLDTGGGNWDLSASGTDEYYITNGAAFYSATKPDKVYIDGVEIVEGTVGSLGTIQWDHGDNDTLGYNTIYIRLVDGADPDTKSTVPAPDNDFIQKSVVNASTDLFRAEDVGKFIRMSSGFVQLTTYTSATSVKGIILKELTTTDDVSSWSLESLMWTAANGYPSVGVFFEERLVAAGSTAYPETVWGSSIGDYENHTPGIDDADAFQFTLSGRKVSVIRWIEPREYLMIGTVDGEWKLGPEDTGSALTPLNVVAKPVGTNGNANIEPVTVNNATLFLQRATKKLLELAYDFQLGEQGGYVAPDMTILAENVTQAGITNFAYQQEPFSIIWPFTADGELLGMTYLRKEEVLAWKNFSLGGDGEVLSTSVIPGDGYDELWAVVERTINGSTVRYVEMMEEIFTDDDDTFQANNGLNAFFVDSGLTYNGAATTTISGLWHLEGESVTILGDGGVISNKTVSNGSITLTSAKSVVHIGLGYTATLQPMRPEAPLREGTAQGKFTQVIDIVCRVHNSGVFKAGRDSSNLDLMQDREYIPTIGSAPPLFTGDIRGWYEGEFTRKSRPLIVQDKPLPLTIIALIYEVDFK
jgi:hypothetical protein